MTYHIARDGTQLGTFTQDEVSQGLATGRFLPTDLAWAEGMADWQPVSSLGGTVPPEVAARPVMAAPAPGLPNLPNPPQRGGAVIVGGESCGQATTSMVLGLLALLLGCLSGIPAIIFGHIAINKIGKSGGRLTGKGRAVTGLVLGYMSILCFPFLLGLAVPAFEGVRAKSSQLVAMNNARQVIISLKTYAADHSGHYPPQLSVLLDEHLLTTDADLTFPAIPKWTGDAGWEYLGASMSDSSPGDEVLLKSLSTGPRGEKIAGYNDGSVQVEKPKEDLH